LRISHRENDLFGKVYGKTGLCGNLQDVDPLFVIDLEEPSKPKILGALKIPGYSDYLHPYDENHIIGFGKDTVEIKAMHITKA